MEGLTFEKFFINYCNELEENGIDPDEFIEDEREVLKLYIAQVVVRKWDIEKAKKRKKERGEKERLMNIKMQKTLDDSLETAFEQLGISEGGLKKQLESLTKSIFKTNKKLM